MWIICIILGILCILLLIRNKLDQYIYEKEFVKLMTKNVYPCILRLIINYEQESESIITNFSQYDEEKIVNVVWNKTEKATTAEEQKINGKMLIYSHAVIFSIGSRWIWVV